MKEAHEPRLGSATSCLLILIKTSIVLDRFIFIFIF